MIKENEPAAVSPEDAITDVFFAADEYSALFYTAVFLHCLPAKADYLIIGARGLFKHFPSSKIDLI